MEDCNIKRENCKNGRLQYKERGDRKNGRLRYKERES